MVDWQAGGAHAAVAQALASTEELLAETSRCADDELHNLVAICFIETVQNLALAGYADYAALEAQLGPHTRSCWDEVEQFWEGDAILAPHLLRMCESVLRFAGHATRFVLLGAAPPRMRRWFWKGSGE